MKLSYNMNRINKRVLLSTGMFLIAAATAGMLACASAGTAYAGEPPAAVSSPETLESQINGFIEEKKDVTPAVAVRVFDADEDFCSIIYGKSDIGNGIAADEDTVFEWGSISKVLIWTSVMQLYERGELDFNKDIREYLPDGFLNNLKYDAPITMLNLMNHDAGFMSPYKEIETDDADEIMSLEEALRKTAPAQAYPPGEVVAYSNYGAALAAYVVECISGMDYADYVKENIFDRLGMNHTALRPDLSDNPWVAEKRKETHCYYVSDEGTLMPFGECRWYIHIYPAGSACGTAADLSAFARAFLSDGNDCPLFEKGTTLDEMLAPSKYYADGVTPRFCHGLMAEQYGTMLLGHGGNTTGFSSLMEIDRESGTGFVMMINLRGDGTYKGGLPELLYGELDALKYASDGFAEYDFTGDYTMSGGEFSTGCFKIYSFFADHFKVSPEGGAYRGTLGVDKLVQISDTMVLVKLATGKEYIYYIKTDADGKLTAIENKSVDIIKTSGISRTLGWGILGLMGLGFAVMTVLAVVHLIRYGKFKNSPLISYKKMELMMGITCLAVMISLIMLAVFGISFRSEAVISCIATALLSVLLVILNVLCICRREGKAGILLLIENICSLFIVTGIIYWRLFQFWGF